MEHKHKWEDCGTSLIKGFGSKQTFTCSCGAIMFEGYLEPDKK